FPLAEHWTCTKETWVRRRRNPRDVCGLRGARASLLLCGRWIGRTRRCGSSSLVSCARADTHHAPFLHHLNGGGVKDLWSEVRETKWRCLRTPRRKNFVEESDERFDGEDKELPHVLDGIGEHIAIRVGKKVRMSFRVVMIRKLVREVFQASDIPS